MSQQSHKLISQNVRRLVPRYTAGFYRLGSPSREGFVTSYYGRSDTNLQRRLLQHAKLGQHSHFAFRATTTVAQAYFLECGEWHLPLPHVANIRHPGAPRGIDAICPYCALQLNPTVHFLSSLV